MAAPERQIRYILTLVVEGGWPDQTLVPRPAEMQRELRATFDQPITLEASQAVQNPSAHPERYYEVQADPAFEPDEI
jgi:hypothetical protein